MAGSLRTIGELGHTFGNSTASSIPVLAALPGRGIGIYRVIFTSVTATAVTVQDTSGGALSEPIALAANGQLVLETQYNGDPWWATGPSLGLQLGQSGAGILGWDVWWGGTPQNPAPPVFPGGGPGPTGPLLTRIFPAERSGLASGAIVDDGSGQSRTISNIAAVT